MSFFINSISISEKHQLKVATISYLGIRLAIRSDDLWTPVDEMTHAKLTCGFYHQLSERNEF